MPAKAKRHGFSRLIVHRQIPQDEALRRQWNDLAQKMESPQVFYTYEWALAVQRAYGESLTPLLFLAYDGDDLLGVVALATDLSRKVSFLTANTADYCDFICSPENGATFVNAVLAELRLLKLDKQVLDSLIFANLPEDSVTSRGLETAGRANGFLVFARPAYLCAQVRMESARQRYELKVLVQSKKMLRRHQKALGKAARVEVQHLVNANDVESDLTRFMNAHVARFLATGRISNLSEPARRIFLMQLAQLLSAQGWMKMSCLMLGDRPIAWNYGFEFGGTWFWYQPTFDGRYQQYSPGACLLAKMVEEACDSPSVSCLDLGLGAEGYKEKLANAGRQTLHVTVTASPVAHVRTAFRYHAAALVKSVPRLERFFREGMSLAIAVQRKIGTLGPWGVLGALVARGKAELIGQREVFFYEWPYSKHFNKARPGDPLSLVPLDLELLASSTVHYRSDSGTLSYLLRCAERLQSTHAQGFALVDRDGMPVHFCWTDAFEGFYMAELRHRLDSPERDGDATMIFDCWTPCSARGRGYYAAAISLLASQLRSRGKNPWIFSAAANLPSVRGVESAGFERKFSLIRNGFLSLKTSIQKVVLGREFPSKAAAA